MHEETYAIIYALTDPDTREIRYIGKTTKTAWKRYREHITSGHGDLRVWIEALQRQGKTPKLEIIEDHVALGKASARERYWITHWRAQGVALCNQQPKVIKPIVRNQKGARMPIPPGEILKDELRAIGISGAKLAEFLHVPPNRISQILRGRRDITADTALRLGRWFGTGPQIWINLQKAYELDVAQQQVGAAIEEIEPRAPVAAEA